MVKKHQFEDTKKIAPDRYLAEQKQIDKLIRINRKIKTFLQTTKDKPGKRQKAVQSNITDNESAKMKCAKGVIQGVNAVTLADAKHQIILAAEVFDSVDERPTLKPLVDQVRNRLRELFSDQDVLKMIHFLADSGFCNEHNLRYLLEEGIDAYVADGQFRKRDPRFKDARQNHQPKRKFKKKFTWEDFYYDSKTKSCVCPMGNSLWLKSPNAMAQGFPTVRFQAHVKDCRICKERKKCLKNEYQLSARQVSFKRGAGNHLAATDQMRQKIDSDQGRAIYNKRLGIIEPVFANITSTLKLNRLSYRGKTKNSMQWTLFCTVHNIGKIMKYGKLPI